MQWLHMMDLSALPAIADELHLDTLICEHFSDLRFHSMLMPTLGGCCLSLCYFQMDPLTLSVGMYKLYFYLAQGIVLTFVAELMPELDELAGGGSGVGSSMGGGSSLTAASVLGVGRGGGGSVTAGEMASSSNEVRTMKKLYSNEDTPVSMDAVFNAVIDRWESLSQRAAELGPMFIFYELATQALAAQDSLLEFLSRTIFHFKKSTNFRLPYRKKVHLIKRLHIVNTGINMMESCASNTFISVDRRAIDVRWGQNVTVVNNTGW